MNSRAAIFTTVSIVFLVMGYYYFFSSEKEDTREQVIIIQAIDGDTVKLADNRTVRLININTPEKKERGYEEAKQFLQTYEGETVLLEVRGTEKYGRLLGALYADERYLNLELVRNGLAHTFLVSDEEEKLFFTAQEEAVRTNAGVWAHSPYYGCLDAEIDKKDEYVVFTSMCASTLDNWTIKDETTHRYVLDGEVATTFTLLSREGNSSKDAKYWGRGNVWNDDRDSLFVRDENQLLVLYSAYGY